MRKKIAIVAFLILTLALSSFGVHKFYMAIYQVNFVPEKKMLQITARIFIDDLNQTLEKKYGKPFFLGSDKETVASVNFLKSYFKENFFVKVNGKDKQMNFLSTEIDNDVLVCYLNCREITNIKSIEISNTMLFERFLEQQNILHITAYGKKNSFLFTVNNTKQVLNY
jgi:hypothetical protein